MKPSFRSSSRWATHGLLFAAGAILFASCGASSPVETGQDAADDPVETAPAELTVNIESEWLESHVPPWEDFEVSLREFTIIEQVTAIGDLGDGNNLLGRNCEQLQADNPEVLDCVEDISRSRRDGLRVDPGNFGADGTLTIPSPEAGAILSISATNLVDDACFFDGSVEVDPGQTSATIVLEEACA